MPKKGEAALGSGGADGTGGSGGAGTAGASNPGGKININTADITQLQTITGVGPVTAQKIIDYRTENGRFSSIEDLKNISGIGEKTFEKMKGDVTV
ncbi:MAG: helix-hairpin-helix domain-containing protein [Bacillota bacterium]|nr:helix-hairpin-helix domain-containing protein [Bacillota bacterium]